MMVFSHLTLPGTSGLPAVRDTPLSVRELRDATAHFGIRMLMVGLVALSLSPSAERQNDPEAAAVDTAMVKLSAELSGV